MQHSKKFFQVLFLFSIVTVLLFAGCSDDDDTTTGPKLQGPDPNTTPSKASDWVSFVNWDEAIRVTLETVEHSEDDFEYSPGHLEFVAGLPYILTMKQSGGNQEKHYLHSPDFYKSIATRKAQTVNAEYKAPYFDDFELVLEGEIDLYFIPVLAGSFDLWCTIEEHREAGMDMKVDIIGEGYSLDLEVDPNFNAALGSDPRRSGSHVVWENATEVTVTMVENSEDDLAFDPSNVNLIVGRGYKLKIQNPAGNESKHYYTASEFYITCVTRKAEDSKAEIKVPYFKAVELLIGGSTELFIVPTVAGTYDVICTITDHESFGMHGTITVSP